MTPHSIAEASLVHPDAKNLWERQDGESARWFMRFRNYLSLGSKRSINGTYELERKEKQLKASTKAGPEWYNAAKRYQWQLRADAWDREQEEQRAGLMRQIASRCAFVSRPFRLAQLNSAAETLTRELEKGHDPVVYLALTRQLQSLLHDIKSETDEWGLQIDASCDAAAFTAWEQKIKRMDGLQAERDEIMEEEFDRSLVQLLQLDPSILPPGTSIEETITYLKETGAHAKISRMAQLRGLIGARTANKMTSSI
jgi:hypothetical protein